MVVTCSRRCELNDHQDDDDDNDDIRHSIQRLAFREGCAVALQKGVDDVFPSTVVPHARKVPLCSRCYFRS